MQRCHSKTLRSTASRWSALGGLALSLSACAIEDAGQFVGRDPYITISPKTMMDQTTMPFPSGRPGVDWGMSLVWEGDHYLLTADQNTTPGQDPQVWRIVAVMDFPLLKKGQMIALGSCRDDGKPAPRVVAVVQYDPDKQWFDAIESAWAYDFHQVAFAAYPTAKLTCLNPRYGLHEDTPPAQATSAAPAAATHPH